MLIIKFKNYINIYIFSTLSWMMGVPLTHPAYSKLAGRKVDT